MADSVTPQQIEQRIRLILEEQINVGKAAKEVDKLLNSLNKTNKSLKTYSTISDKATKESTKMAKAMFTVGQASKIALTSATKLVGILASYAKTSLGGTQSLIKFGIASNNVNRAISSLKSSYASLEKSNKSMNISLQNSADLLGNFASQSLAARQALSSSAQAKVINLTNKLARKVGKQQAMTMMGEFSQSMSATAFAEIIESKGFESGALLDKVSGMGGGTDAGNKYAQITQALGNTSSLGPITSMNDVLGRMDTLVEKLGMSFVEVFGGTLQKTFDKLSNDIFPEILRGMKNFFDMIERNAPQIQSTLNSLMDIMKKIVSFVADHPLLAGGLVLGQKSGLAGGLGGMAARGVGGWMGGKLAAGASAVGGGSLAAGGTIMAGVLTVFDSISSNITGNKTWVAEYIGEPLGKKIAEWRTGTSEAELGQANPLHKQVVDRLNAQDAKAAEAAAKATNDAKEKAFGATDFDTAAKKWESLSPGVGGASGKIDLARQIMASQGMNAKIGGKSVLDFMGAAEGDAGTAAGEAKKIADAALVASEKMKKNAKSDEDRVRANNAIREAMEMQSTAAQMINAQLDAIVAKNEILGQRQAEQTGLAKANMEIARATYGSAALSIEAAKQVVTSLEAERRLNDENLQKVQKEIDLHGETQSALQKRNELLQKGKDLTLEQLNTVKELRDGYINAVEASVFGAGQFSKIIISQEQNLGKAMDSRMVKKNYLLGQVGSDATQGNAQAFRYGTGGIGDIRGLDGGSVGAAAIAAQHTANIADPNARAVSQMAQDIVMKGQAQKAVMDRYLTAGLRGAGFQGTRGTPGGGVMEGEAARRNLGRPAPPSASASGGGGEASQQISKILPILTWLGKMVDQITTEGNGGTTPRSSSRFGSTPSAPA